MRDQNLFFGTCILIIGLYIQQRYLTILCVILSALFLVSAAIWAKPYFDWNGKNDFSARLWDLQFFKKAKLLCLSATILLILYFYILKYY